MKSKFTFVILAFIISLGILAYITLSFQTRISNLVNTVKAVDHSNEVIKELHILENYVKEAETGQRGFLLTGDSLLLQPYLTFSQMIIPASSRLQDLTKDNLQVQNKVIKLRSLISRRMEFMHFNLINYESNPQQFKENVIRGNRIMDSCRTLFASIAQDEDKLFRERLQLQSSYVLSTPENFRYFFVFTFIIFLFSFALILKELIQRLKYQRELEIKITELNRTYAELQQVTFVASHDLQEPLRKIRIFSNKLETKKDELQDPESRMIVNRIGAASGRIHGLIEDLVSFMNLTKTNEELSRMDLKDVIEGVVHSLTPSIQQKNAVVEIQVSVTLNGYKSQIALLFKSLLDNSFKFAKPGTSPHVVITGEHLEITDNKHPHTGKWYKITVRDKGIGFDQEFNKKIFQLFKRLHAQDSVYEGKGVGLSMVERIMVNHRGFVEAEGRTGEGAAFYLYFPMEG